MRGCTGENVQISATVQNDARPHHDCRTFASMPFTNVLALLRVFLLLYLYMVKQLESFSKNN